MKVRGLQQQLAASTYLLPSQRDVLSRLLFQLAFNDFTRLAIIGGVGSGKTTLALALAELFSECQDIAVNVAMLQAPLSDELLAAQLARQWFAEPGLTKEQLSNRLAIESVSTELVLIADDLERLTATQYDWLLTLPVRLFMFGSNTDANMQLNLTLPVITLADCEQLLQAESLDPLALAERFANSQQNLHKLLRDVVAKPVQPKAQSASRKPLFAAVVGVCLVLLVLLTSILNGDSEPKINEPKITAAKGNLDAVPLPPVAKSDNQPVPIEVDSDITTPELLTEQPEPVVVDSEDDVEHDLAATGITAEPLVADSKPQSVEESVVVIAPVAPPAAVVPTPSRPATADATSVNEAAYDHVALLQAPAKQLLVQIAVLSSENALRRFTRSYPQLPVLVYQRRWQGREQWVIVSGPFANNNAAKQHLQQLPTALSASGPFIKTVGAVQQEIYAWQRLKLAETSQDN